MSEICYKHPSGTIFRREHACAISQAYVQTLFQIEYCLCLCTSARLEQSSDGNMLVPLLQAPAWNNLQTGTVVCLEHSSDKIRLCICHKRLSGTLIKKGVLSELVSLPQAHVWNTLQTGTGLCIRQCQLRRLSSFPRIKKFPASIENKACKRPSWKRFKIIRVLWPGALINISVFRQVLSSSSCLPNILRLVFQQMLSESSSSVLECYSAPINHSLCRRACTVLASAPSAHSLCRRAGTVLGSAPIRGAQDLYPFPGWRLFAPKPFKLAC